MSLSLVGIVALVVIGAAVLAAVHVTGRRAAIRDRGRVFDDVLAAVEDPVIVRRGDDYPELHGRVGGHPVRLRVLVDALVLRKLPVLWLEVVVRRSVPVAGSVSVLLRPHGAEYFSPNARFPHELPTPASFPRPARVAVSEPDATPALGLLEPLAGYLAEPRTKEVGLGPGGLRSVRLLASADQGAYRVSRRASFTGARVPLSDVVGAVDVLAPVGDHEHPREITT